MSAHFPSFLSFSKLAIATAAAMVVFGSASVVGADDTETYPEWSAADVLKKIDTGSGVPIRMDQGTYYLNALMFVYEGMSWVVAGGHDAFCVPPKLALTKEQLSNILRRWVAESPPAFAKYQLGLAMLLALEDAFPCE